MFDRDLGIRVDTTLWSDAEIERWFSLPSRERGPAFAEDLDDWVETDPLDEIARLERQLAMLAGQQLRAIAQHQDRVWDETEPQYQDRACRAASAEVALRLGLSAQTVDRRLSDAQDLVRRLPATLEAMCGGKFGLKHVRAILDETENITDREILARVEAEVLALAEGMVPERLREQVRGIVERLDAEALRKRAEKAHEERSVRLFPEADGMATVRAYLAADKAHEMFGVVDGLAHAGAGPDEERTIDQLRADIIHDLICNPGDQPSRVAYEAQILVPADLLLSRDGAGPARMADGSPIADDLARAIAADSRWRRILTDPITRHLLDLAPNTYEPSDRMIRFIKTRDQRCRWPGCGRRAKRCQIDHALKFRIGGRTIVTNLGALCVRHHQVKDMPGWQAIQDPETGAITFITPRGDRHTTRPPTVDGDQHPVEVVLARTRAEDDIPPF